MTRRLLGFLAHYVGANFQMALEYRVSFWAQVFAMVLNDAMWIGFWALFFGRFSVVRGYRFEDLVTLWAVVALAFGLATGIFGNAWRFATQVAQGELDFYLVMPKPVLLHVIVSRMSVSSWGDALFGVGVFVVLVRPSPAALALYLVLSLAAMVIVVCYGIVANALAFWLGNAEGVARELQNALLMFSTYPSSLFTGGVRVVLFTVVPAGLVAYVPVELLREWSWMQALSLLLAAAAAVALATLVFYAGLRRYESGNLLAMRG
jgi:ABC-2 type transport system permease protein